MEWCWQEYNDNAWQGPDRGREFSKTKHELVLFHRPCYRFSALAWLQRAGLSLSCFSGILLLATRVSTESTVWSAVPHKAPFTSDLSHKLRGSQTTHTSDRLATHLRAFHYLPQVQYFMRMTHRTQESAALMTTVLLQRIYIKTSQVKRCIVRSLEGSPTWSFHVLRMNHPLDINVWLSARKAQLIFGVQSFYEGFIK